MSSLTLASRLENYTLKHPQEVLIVYVEIEGEVDQIIIFKGFSSSLMRPTAVDPEVSMLPDSATVSHIDRLKAWQQTTFYLPARLHKLIVKTRSRPETQPSPA